LLISSVVNAIALSGVVMSACVVGSVGVDGRVSGVATGCQKNESAHERYINRVKIIEWKGNRTEGGNKLKGNFHLHSNSDCIMPTSI
jgi:hypothetical protein